MTAPRHSAGPQPTRLLLATDLSARCDRALDRASLLAATWRAELIVLNVLEEAQPPDLLLRSPPGEAGTIDELALRQIEHDLAAPDVPVSIHLARGNVEDAIRDLARSEDCGLVVTGMARNEAFGRFLLGSTVQRLARSLETPLLVVRNRARHDYRRIVVATDLSESSREALQTAARLFPRAELVVHHAHQGPLRGLADRPGSAETTCRAIERDELARFVADCGLAAESRIRVAARHGALETTLTALVREYAADLVVIGSHGRSGLIQTLLGSTAARLLDWLTCDTLLVRPRRPRGTGPA